MDLFVLFVVFSIGKCCVVCYCLCVFEVKVLIVWCVVQRRTYIDLVIFVTHVHTTPSPSAPPTPTTTPKHIHDNNLDSSVDLTCKKYIQIERDELVNIRRCGLCL